MTLPSLKDQELSKIEQEHQPKDHKISVKLTDSIDTKKITLRHYSQILKTKGKEKILKAKEKLHKRV